MNSAGLLGMLLLLLAGSLRAQVGTRVVEEKGIRVSLVGVSETNELQIREVVQQQLQMANDTQPSPPLADDLAFFVETLYRELGYPEVDVEWTIPDRGIVLAVREGPEATIGKITFTGGHPFTAQELEDQLLRPTKEIRPPAGPQIVFIELKLQEGATIVQRYCQSLGYLDAVVDEPVFTPHEGGLVWDVNVHLTPGKQYHFGPITFTGDLVGEEEYVRELVEGLEGLPFNEVKVESLRNDIIAFFQERGYFRADCTATYSLSRTRDGVAPVVYRVNPGIRFRVTSIEVKPGLSRGAQRLVRGSLNDAIGDLYVPGEIEIMHRRTMDTEVFSKLDLEPVAYDDGTMKLVLSGTEAQRGRLSTYAGYETFKGPILGFEGRRVNLWDMGYAAQLEAEASGRGWSSTLKFINPALFDSSYAFDIALSHYTEEFFDIIDTASGVRSTLRKQFSRHLTMSGFVEVSGHEISSDFYADLFELLIGPLDYKVAMTGLDLALDYRDSPVLPKKGWFMSLGVKGGTGFGGSDVEFIQTDTNFSAYLPITKKFRVAGRARSSVIYNNGGLRNLPFDLRLFNGGATTVRSFSEQELGLTLETIGGVQTDTFNLEFSYEVVPNLELALFGDAGSLQGEAEGPFSGFGDLRYAVGLGVRYKLPFGPLRIDYGVNPDRREGEDFGALHITFGFAF